MDFENINNNMEKPQVNPIDPVIAAEAQEQGYQVPQAEDWGNFLTGKAEDKNYSFDIISKISESVSEYGEKLNPAEKLELVKDMISFVDKLRDEGKNDNDIVNDVAKKMDDRFKQAA